MASEVVIRDKSAFTHAPKDWSHIESATITTAGLTAWRALVGDGQTKAGDTILTLGTGGVSIAAIQIANMLGAKVIVTSSSDEKLERAKAIGVAHGINYRTHPNWSQKVMELTDGKGVVPTALLMAKQARLQGLVVGNRQQQKEYISALEANDVRPVIDKVYKFEQLAEAFCYQETGNHFGKICLEW
ncbi:zinc-dependent alcohol dehydrogenase family protein [Vibrio sp. YIC-376]|uniref:zinc-dependent alcohol dehydrogenase family protein n=1 Tax=Vibrio sp. YIC-376 TaxID=3136162 RepID=UPI00402A7071